MLFTLIKFFSFEEVYVQHYLPSAQALGHSFPKVCGLKDITFC